ncbi:RDD family protein [Planococcus massiliensis]|uniref:RDD family protein n=1 Tax=Planococcus massiliensis TaxID=1499687 RepID=A0A098EG48_9BACL|nr:RDD family protein [Planococcus massiliensis]CEG21274.1 RDD family protein [Planococcus massiliensis]
MTKDYAGFWIRFIANLIDGIILGIPIFIVDQVIFKQVTGMTEEQYYALNELSTAGAPPSYLWYSFLFTTLAGILYYGILTSSKKQATFGKMAMGIKVVDANGQRMGFLRSAIRYLGYIPSGFLLFFGYIMIAFTEKKRGLHDYIANSYVVYK